MLILLGHKIFSGCMSRKKLNILDVELNEFDKKLNDLILCNGIYTAIFTKLLFMVSLVSFSDP